MSFASARPRQLFGLALQCAAVLLMGCGDGSSRFDWHLSFSNAPIGRASVVVEARILRGGCEGDVRYSVEMGRGEMAGLTPPALESGTWGFEGLARDDTCRVIASGCVEVTIPNDATVQVTMRPQVPMPGCPAAVCMRGRCGGAGVDGGPCTDRESRCADSTDDDCDGRTDCADSDCAADSSCAACVGVTCDPCSVCRDGSCEPAPDGEACAAGVCHAGACCAGCWDGSACQSGDTGEACGTGGADCSLCDECGSCAGGACAPVAPGTACGGGMGLCAGAACCTGCVAGGMCEPGTLSSACGAGGTLCTPCGECTGCSGGACVPSPGSACPGGICTGGSCCTGCLSGATCQPGTARSACGAGGSRCADCGALACSAGACS